MDQIASIIGNIISLKKCLILEKKDFPQELIITAVTKNGDQIMAFEHSKFPTFGVQFHPESIGTPDGQKILENFIKI